MSTLTNIPASSGQVATNKLWQAGGIAAVFAVVSNLIFWFITARLLQMELIVFAQGPGSPLMPVSPMMIILTSAVPAVAATILLAILGKAVARPFRVFQIIAGVFLLLSLGGPLSLPAEVPMSAKVVLSLMHIVAGAAIVWALGKYAKA